MYSFLINNRNISVISLVQKTLVILDFVDVFFNNFTKFLLNWIRTTTGEKKIRQHKRLGPEDS